MYPRAVGNKMGLVLFKMKAALTNNLFIVLDQNFVQDFTNDFLVLGLKVYLQRTNLNALFSCPSILVELS